MEGGRELVSPHSHPPLDIDEELEQHVIHRFPLTDEQREVHIRHSLTHAGDEGRSNTHHSMHILKGGESKTHITAYTC